jgi:hypothetical protein
MLHNCAVERVLFSNLRLNIPLRNCDSSVCKVTRLWAGQPQSNSWDKQGMFLLATASRLAVGPTQPPIQCELGTPSPVVNWPGGEADHSPPSSTEVKNVRNCVTPLLHVFMAWWLFNSRMSSWCSTLLTTGHLYLTNCGKASEISCHYLPDWIHFLIAEYFSTWLVCVSHRLLQPRNQDSIFQNCDFSFLYLCMVNADCFMSIMPSDAWPDTIYPFQEKIFCYKCLPWNTECKVVSRP